MANRSTRTGCLPGCTADHPSGLTGQVCSVPAGRVACTEGALVVEAERYQDQDIGVLPSAVALSPIVGGRLQDPHILTPRAARALAWAVLGAADAAEASN